MASIFGSLGWFGVICAWFLHCSIYDNTKCLKDGALKRYGYLGRKKEGF